MAPVDHKLPVADDEVKVTLPPVHNPVGPLVVIVGFSGNGFTVTFLTVDGNELQTPLFTVTVYNPDSDTVIVFEFAIYKVPSFDQV